MFSEHVDIEQAIVMRLEGEAFGSRGGVSVGLHFIRSWGIKQWPEGAACSSISMLL